MRRTLTVFAQPKLLSWIASALLLVLSFMMAPSAMAVSIASSKIMLTSAVDDPAPPSEQAQSTLQTLETTNTGLDIYGVVKRIEAEGIRVIGGQEEHYQRLFVLLDEGLPGSTLAKLPHRGHHAVVSVENVLGDNPGYRLIVRPGTRVLLSMQSPVKRPGQAPQEAAFSLVNVDRTPGLWILGTLSILALLLIGGAAMARQGALWFLFAISVGNLFLPLVRAGHASAGWSLGFLCLLFPVIVSTMEAPLNASEDPKFTRWRTRQCIAGVWGGSLILLLLLLFMHAVAHLNGYTSEGLIELWTPEPQLNYWMLYLAGVLIGFQGFLYLFCRNCLDFDSASFRHGQDSENDEQPLIKKRFIAIMQHGRRQLGPVLLGLGFLSLGLSLPATMQFQSGSVAQFINQESAASALTYSLSGCLSLLIMLPLLSGLVAFFPFQSKSPLVKPNYDSSVV